MMARLSKQEWKRHDDAEALLSLSRALTSDEVAQVMSGWHPEARTNVGVAGAFFTPLALALDLTMFVQYGGERRHYLDLCAGIGRLSYAMALRHEKDGGHTHVTAVEINPEYIDVGRRVLRDVPRLSVDWVQGNAFDMSVVGAGAPYHVGISNPPFGKPKTATGAGLRFTGSAELMAAEVILRTCTYGGALICGTQIVPWRRSLRGAAESVDEVERSEYGRWRMANTGWMLQRMSLDTSVEAYQFDVSVRFEVATIEREDEVYTVPAEFAGLPLFEGVPA